MRVETDVVGQVTMPQTRCVIQANRSMPPETQPDDETLQRCLERLELIAPIRDAAELLPIVQSVEPPIRCDVLIELIKFDMAAAADAGQIPRIENYAVLLTDFLVDVDIPLSLVLEEQQILRNHDMTMDANDDQRRFPHLKSMLRQWRDSGSAKTSVPTPVRSMGPNLLSGQTIDDFQILQPLGSGAFAQVYLARQVSMQRLVALKVSRGGGGESQTLARLDHPNIVRVFDQRTLPFDGPHLLYMQYQPGGTLADVVARVKATPPHQRDAAMLLRSIDERLLAAAQQVPERSPIRDWLEDASWPMVVAWIGVQLGHALQAAHDQGVLHRDVKPANVLLSAEGIPKLADFNVSFAASTDESDGVESLGGSIGYMAPEHLAAIAAKSPGASTDVGGTADLYSAAVLLWELWQGERPFARPAGAASTPASMLHQQLDLRIAGPTEPARCDGGGGGERTLENVLRQTLSLEPAQRPQTGSEWSGRLRLALHPSAARLFDPDEGDWRHRLAAISPSLVAAVVILTPNIAAGLFNYAYNEREIIQGHVGMKDGFERLAKVINCIAFPTGGLLIIGSAWPLVRAMRQARQGVRVAPDAVTRTLHLSHRAAWIGGSLWLIAAVVYPLTLSAWYPQFSAADAWHFFGSLLICGGVAMAYPFLGLTVLSTLVYYPRLIRGSMQDSDFDDRHDRLRAACGWYLMTAAGVPLLGLTLFLSRDSMAKDIVAASIAATAVGLVAAFAAYQCVLMHWQQMADVLSPQRRQIVPGTSRH